MYIISCSKHYQNGHVTHMYFKNFTFGREYSFKMTEAKQYPTQIAALNAIKEYGIDELNTKCKILNID